MGNLRTIWGCDRYVCWTYGGDYAYRMKITLPYEQSLGDPTIV